MIIFGWRSLVKNIGIVFKHLCDNCHNEKYWVLTRVTRWFTLFFVPVLPISSKYFLNCPVCKYGTQLNSEQIAKFKPIAEANTLLASGKITEQEYSQRLNLPKRAEAVSTVNPASDPALTGPVSATTGRSVVKEQTLASFCKNCGSRLDGGEKFCGQCGQLITI